MALAIGLEEKGIPLQQQSAKCGGLWISLCIMLIGGCSSQNGEQPEVSIPQEIQSDGRIWKKSELTDRNKRDLNRYFHQHPELCDHLGLDGVMALYSAGETKRFYWILASRGGHTWMYLEQRLSRFTQMKEGTGEPFP